MYSGDIKQVFQHFIKNYIKKVYSDYKGDDDDIDAPWNNDIIIQSFQKVLLWKKEYKKNKSSISNLDDDGIHDIIENLYKTEDYKDYNKYSNTFKNQKEVRIFKMWFDVCSSSNSSIRSIVCKNIINAKRDGIDINKVLDEISNQYKIPVPALLYGINNKEDFSDKSFNEIKNIFFEKKDEIIYNFKLDEYPSYFM